MVQPPRKAAFTSQRQGYPHFQATCLPFRQHFIASKIVGNAWLRLGIRADNVTTAMKVENVAARDETGSVDQAGRYEDMAFRTSIVAEICDARGRHSTFFKSQ